MARNVDNIYIALTLIWDQQEDLTIDASLDPNIAMLVTSSTVTSVKHSRVRLYKNAQQRIHGFLDNKHTFM